MADDALARSIFDHHGQNAAPLGASHTRAGDSAVVDFFTNRIPLFPVLSSFETNQPQLFVILGLIVYLAQHLGFIINVHFRDAWGYIIGEDIVNIFYGFHVPLYDPRFVYSASSSSLIGMVYASLALGLVFYGIILFYHTTSANTDKQNPAFVYFNRLLVHALTTVLLIPILQICFAGMVCGKSGTIWYFPSDASSKCWGSAHLATFIPSAVFLAAVVPLLYLSLCCQFDSRTESEHLKSRRHSVVDEICFAHTVLSCALFQVLLGYDMRGTFAIVHGVSSAVVAVSYAYYLPYFEMSMNQLMCAIHTVEALASTLVAAFLLNRTFAIANITSTLFISLLPFAIVYALIFAKYRINPEFFHQLQLCQTEHLLPPSTGYNVVFPRGLVDDREFPPFPELENQVVECVTRQESAFPGEDSMSKENEHQYGKNEVLAAFLTDVHVPADVDLAAYFVGAFVRQMNNPPTLAMLVFATKVFSRGVTTFQHNSMVLHRFASFIVQFIPTMSFLGLELIESMSLNPDTSFVLRYRAFHTAGELRLALGIRNQAHLLHSNKARSMHSKVLSHMHNFWLKLTEPSVNIGQVSEIAEEINVSRRNALQQFRRALQHQTTSDALLVHRMGDFLRDVMMDSEGANECYNEAKEIHEARQARSMRGTKQHTTVELDVETLTDRLIHLLEGKRESNSTNQASSVVQYLLMNVTMIFAALLAVVALFLYVAIDEQSKNQTFVDRVVGTSILRTKAPSFVGNLLQILSDENETRIDHVTALLASDASQFSTSLADITSGSFKSSDAAQVNLFTDNKVPAFIPEDGNARGYALWSLGEKLLSNMQSIVQLANRTGLLSLSNSNPNAQFLISGVDSVMEAFDYTVHLTEQEVQSTVSSILSWCVALFVVGIVTLAVTYVAFLVSFRRTALGRVFTFQLFTLIPFDDLEKLATETKDKVQSILDESKTHETTENQNNNNATAVNGELADDITKDDADKDSETRRRSSSKSRHSVSGQSQLFALTGLDANFQVKSCLKKTTTRSAKRVQFNPLIETFGGKDEEVTTLGVKKEDPNAKRGDEKGDEEEPLLLERKQQSETLRRAREGEYSTTAKATFMVGFGVMIIFGMIGVLLLGVSLGQISTVGPTFVSFSTSRLDSWTSASLSFNLLDDKLNQFVFSGTVVDFENYVTSLSAAKASFAGSLGMSTDEIRLVTEIEQNLEQLTVTHLDAAMLAAIYFNTDLSSFSMMRSRIVLPPAQFLANTKQTYLTASSRAAKRAQNTNTLTVTEQALAWAILSDDIAERLRASIAQNALLVSELLWKDAKNDVIASIKPAALPTALAIFALAAVTSFLLMIPDVDLLTTDHVGRVHFAVLVGCICIPLGLTAGVIANGNSAVTSVDDSHSLTTQVASALDVYLSSMSQTRYYVTTGETRFFYNQQSADFITAMDHFPALMTDHNLMTSSAFSQLSTIYSSAVVLQRLSKVATSIAISAYSLFVQTEPEMTAFFDQTSWWYSKEDEYRFAEEQFPKRSPKYDQSSTDLAKTSDVKIPLGIATVFDSRSRYYHNGVVDNFLYMDLNTSSAMSKRVATAADNVKTLLIVALASTVFPLCWCVYIMVKLAFLFTHVMGLQANQSTNSMDTSLYTALISRCQYALMALLIMLCATFGTGIWSSQTAYIPINQVNLATRRDYLIAKSLMNVRTLISNTSRVATEAVLRNDIHALTVASRELYFGDTSAGSFYAAGTNTNFDELTFGPTNKESTDTVASSYFADVCGSLIHDSPQAFATRGPFAGLTGPTQQGIFYWRILLASVANVAGAVTSSADSKTKLMEYHAMLTELRDPLLNALQSGSTILYDQAKSKAKTSSTVFEAVAAATIAAVMIVYVFVFLPTVQVLVDEEESAKLLLRMIPIHVRDQVPAISEFIETGKIDNAAELQKKFEASEKLLQNILPQKIAARLKSGEQPIADTHPCLTILFTDFVGFTKRSSNMRADEIVDFLNEVFLEFDTIVELLELEKIKTIGDAYFMAGGLDPRISDHAMRVIEAGFMFFQALDEHNARHPDRSLLQMRLGVHTGPAVAGVIGTKKVAYDLWGESVEIANAMESTGIPGKVHISEDTANHVTGFYKLEPRGELPREKEHIPDCMPATFLITGRLLPTPYQHIQRPRMLQTKIATEKQS